MVGLTADGALDLSFGANGIFVIDPPFSCNSMVAQPDGRLVVAGTGEGAGVAIRLLASGDPDPTFGLPPARSTAPSDCTVMSLT